MENPTKKGKSKPEKPNLKRLQEELLEESYEVLEDVESYVERANDPDNKKLREGIEMFRSLVDLSGDTPAEKLHVLFEATTNNLKLFPIKHLKYDDGLKIEFNNNFMEKLALIKE